jgi:hypothetical protein
MARDLNRIELADAAKLIQNLVNLRTNPKYTEITDILLNKSFGATLPLNIMIDETSQIPISHQGVKCWFCFDNIEGDPKLFLTFHKVRNWNIYNADALDEMPQLLSYPTTPSIFAFDMQCNNRVGDYLRTHDDAVMNIVQDNANVILNYAKNFYKNFPKRFELEVHNTMSGFFNDDEIFDEIYLNLRGAGIPEAVDKFRYYFGWSDDLDHKDFRLRVIVCPVDSTTNRNILWNSSGESVIFQKSWPPK